MSLFLYIQIMGKFNWWRRHRKRKLLTRKEAFKGRSFLLQQIEHGDFELSDYLKQAKDELILAEKEKQVLEESWIAGPDSLKYRLDEIDRKYIKRHNKLMEDYDKDESNMLAYLKHSLHKEFGVDCWEESLEKYGLGTLEDFYYGYKKLANGKS